MKLNHSNDVPRLICCQAQWVVYCPYNVRSFSVMSLQWGFRLEGQEIFHHLQFLSTDLSFHYCSHISTVMRTDAANKSLSLLIQLKTYWTLFKVCLDCLLKTLIFKKVKALVKRNKDITIQTVSWVRVVMFVNSFK